MTFRKILVLLLVFSLMSNSIPVTKAQAAVNPSLKIITKDIYSDKPVFSDGLALIKDSKGFRFIDYNGNVKIGPYKTWKYKTRDSKGIIHSVTKNINIISDFKDGVAIIDNSIVIDKQGKELMQTGLVSSNTIKLCDYADGYFLALNENKQDYFYLDRKGKALNINIKEIVGEGACLGNYTISEGLMYFYQNDKLGAININTKKVTIQPKFRYIGQFKNGTAFASYTVDETSRNTEYGIIDKAGNIIVQLKYDEIGKDIGGTIPVVKNKKWGVIDRKGKIIINPNSKYEILWYSNGMAAIVDSNQKMGFLNTKGEMVISPRYDDVFCFKNEVALVGNRGVYYFIDKTGRQVNPEKTWNLGYTMGDSWGIREKSLYMMNDFIEQSNNVFSYSLTRSKWGIAKIIYSNSSAQKNLVVKDFNLDQIYGMTSAIWDGKKYIAVSNDKVSYSNNGVDWEYQKASIIGAKNIAYVNKRYSMTGDFLATSVYPNEKKNISFYYGSRKYQNILPVASSSDGITWKAITGAVKTDGEINSWGWDTKLITAKGKFYHFFDCNVQISSDGKTYKNHLIYVKDPKKLTPKGYKYLGQSSINWDVIFDGKKFIAQNSDYYGGLILNSKDGSNWEVVKFLDKKKYQLAQHGMSPVMYVNKKFRVMTYESIFESTDGTKWKEQKLSSVYKSKTIQKMLRKNLDTRPVYNGEYYLIPDKVVNEYGDSIYSSKVIATKDFKGFYEVNMGSQFNKIIYMDKKYVITSNRVYDYKVLKSYISKAELIK